MLIYIYKAVVPQNINRMKYINIADGDAARAYICCIYIYVLFGRPSPRQRISHTYKMSIFAKHSKCQVSRRCTFLSI